MPHVLQEEFLNTDKPLMLVSGDTPHCTLPLVNTLKEHVNLIILNNPHTFEKDSRILHVYATATSTITRLEEKIPYALFFLNSTDDKRTLQNLFPKLEKDKTKTLILIPVRRIADFVDVVLATKSLPTVTFALVGDLFGDTIPSSSSVVSQTIHRALSKKEAVFTGNDLRTVFPISFPDFVTGVQSVLFSKPKKRVLFFFYEHPQTLLSAIHIIKRVEPDLRIIYEDTEHECEASLTHKQIEQEVTPKTHLTPSYMDEIFQGFEKSIATITPQQVKTKKSRLKRLRKLHKKVSPHSGFFVNAGLIGIMVFLIINVISTLTGVVLAKQVLNEFQNGNFSRAQKNAEYANLFLSVSHPTVSTLFSLASKTNSAQILEYQHVYERGIVFTKLAAQEIKKLERVQTTSLSQDELKETLATGSYVYFALQQERENSMLSQFASLLNSSQSSLIALGPVLPDILGYSEPKRYLVLFQNNGELRPTGGFIGSVGELEVKNGAMTDFVIHDVYNVDGQIKTHFEPPFIVRRYLQPHLYLRDSNFALDFQESATTAATLYKEGTKRTAHGVIAVDYETLRKIIEATGPIHLPNYNQTIDEKNGFEYIQSTIEDTFFPGSTQKKEILSEVFTQLVTKLKEPKNSLQALQLLPGLMQSKHILFAFYDPTIQETFSVQGFGGQFVDTRTKNRDTYLDFLAINEANIGVNKANTNVSRKLSLTSTFRNRQVTSNATLTLSNNHPKEDYKVFVRFVVPRESTFTSLEIDGKEEETSTAITDPRVYESKSFVLPKTIERVEEVYADKHVFGFVVTVPKNTIKTITLTYTNRYSPPAAGFTYSLFHIKQPGTAAYPFSATVVYPETYTPHMIKDASFGKQSVLFSENATDKDLLFLGKMRKR